MQDVGQRLYIDDPTLERARFSGKFFWRIVAKNRPKEDRVWGDENIPTILIETDNILCARSREEKRRRGGMERRRGGLEGEKEDKLHTNSVDKCTRHPTNRALIEDPLDSRSASQPNSTTPGHPWSCSAAVAVTAIGLHLSSQNFLRDAWAYTQRAGLPQSTVDTMTSDLQAGSWGDASLGGPLTEVEMILSRTMIEGATSLSGERESYWGVSESLREQE
jgi:hypothetical protein